METEKVNLSTVVYPKDIKYVGFVREKEDEILVILMDKDDKSVGIVMHDMMIEGLITSYLEFYETNQNDKKQNQLILRLDKHQQH